MLLFPAEHQPEAAARKTSAGQGQGRAASRRLTVNFEPINGRSRQQAAPTTAEGARRAMDEHPRARLRRTPPRGSVPHRFSAARWGHPVFTSARDYLPGV